MSAITYSITYDVVTEESAEIGDFAESGFSVEPTTATFRELVECIRSRGVEYLECWRIQHTCWNGLRITHFEDINYRTGDSIIETTHITCDGKTAARIIKFLK